MTGPPKGKAPEGALNAPEAECRGGRIIPRYDETVRFLQHVLPQGPWCTCAIHPEQQEGDKQPLKVATFFPGDEEKVRAWLNENSRRNLYWQPGTVARPMTDKPSKEDMTGSQWLWDDIDPIDGRDLDEERRRILAEIQAFSPRPSVLVDSGSGLQPLWRLSDRADAEAVESRNKGLAQVLGGDSCHAINQLMRLPGTVNWPGYKKRRRGRVAALARIVCSATTTSVR